MMLSDPLIPYYGAMGLAAFVCVVAAIYYLRLSTQIGEILSRHSADWYPPPEMFPPYSETEIVTGREIPK